MAGERRQFKWAYTELNVLLRNTEVTNLHPSLEIAQSKKSQRFIFFTFKGGFYASVSCVQIS